jgi:hypothetical protein
MSTRGCYGDGAAWVGQVPRYASVYVERPRSSLPWIVAAAGLGASLLWARHQSRQIEQLSAAAGIPYKSFTSDLRDSASRLTSRLRSRPARNGLAAPTKGED